MMDEPVFKKIGVLTSGGDAPGMNAAIRAVVRTALSNNMKVYGVHHGYNGLIEDDIEEMHIRSVSEIIHRGGTMLYTARSPEFLTLQGQQTAAANCRKHGIQAMVVIGGDGSYRGARDLAQLGMKVVGIPGTIDNDISCSEYTIGYDTAMNTVLDAIDKIRDTSYSHERCSVLEVMGRKAGWIAINCGIAGGAEAVVLPENSFDIDKDIIKPIIDGRNRGKKHYLVIVAEGVGGAVEIAKYIEEKTDIITRATILGHIQRGGSPTLQDRVMGSRMGVFAIEALHAGRYNRIIAVQQGKLVDLDITEALAMTKSMEQELVDISRILAL